MQNLPNHLLCSTSLEVFAFDLTLLRRELLLLAKSVAGLISALCSGTEIIPDSQRLASLISAEDASRFARRSSSSLRLRGIEGVDRRHRYVECTPGAVADGEPQRYKHAVEVPLHRSAVSGQSDTCQPDQSSVTKDSKRLYFLNPNYGPASLTNHEACLSHLRAFVRGGLKRHCSRADLRKHNRPLQQAE